MFALFEAPNDLKSVVLSNDKCLLRCPDMKDIDVWIALREISRDHLTEWEPNWSATDLTPSLIRSRMKAQRADIRHGRSLPLFIFTTDGVTLVGGVTLSNIRHQSVSSAQIGYWIGAPFLRQGYAAAAVASAVDFAMKSLGLNRIEAACQPNNERSTNLLEKIGFEREGLARDYLFINGDWRDHVLFALTARRFDSLRVND